MKLLMAICIGFMALSVQAKALPTCKKSGGWGGNCPYNTKFKYIQDQYAQGYVKEIKVFTPLKTMSPGLLLILSVGKSTIEFHLGPKWFFDHQDTLPRKGQKLIVGGIEGTLEGKKINFASSLNLRGKNLKLRKLKEPPVWSLH